MTTVEGIASNRGADRGYDRSELSTAVFTLFHLKFGENIKCNVVVL